MILGHNKVQEMDLDVLYIEVENDVIYYRIIHENMKSCIDYFKEAIYLYIESNNIDFNGKIIKLYHGEIIFGDIVI